MSNPFFLYTGYFGFYLLGAISIFMYMRKKILLFGVISGYFANKYINTDLKRLFKEPRPSQEYHYVTFDLEEKIIPASTLGVQEYGMPSGHSQNAWFFTSFMYFSLKSLPLTSIFALISCITGFQRVAYKNHTIKQVIMGAIVGGLFGYMWYHIITNSLPYIPPSSFF
jgi:membrane-associated phospholipid phosphatase